MIMFCQSIAKVAELKPTYHNKCSLSHYYLKFLPIGIPQLNSQSKFGIGILQIRKFYLCYKQVKILTEPRNYEIS